jgi:hypothetical protein
MSLTCDDDHGDGGGGGGGGGGDDHDNHGGGGGGGDDDYVMTTATLTVKNFGNQHHPQVADHLHITRGHLFSHYL